MLRAGALAILVLAGCGRVTLGSEDDAAVDPDLDAAGAADDAGTAADAGPAPGADAAAVCEADPCRLMSPQCGCPAGQGCYVETDDEAEADTVCLEAGSAATSEVCADQEDCLPGQACLGASDARVCHPVCETDGDCEDPALCVLDIRTTAGPVVARACSIDCDPVDSSGCPDDLACNLFIDGESDRTFATCTAATPSGTDGAFCDANGPSDCARGFMCVLVDGGDRVCKEMCRVGDANTCSSGTCFSLNPELVYDGTEYGFCE